MKRILTGIVLALCAFAANAQTTQITASNISRFGGAKVTGQFCVSPTDSSGNPINLTTPNGQQFSPTTPLCFPITAGVLSNAAIVPDTSLTQPANACYKLTVYDNHNNQIGTYPCIQPTGTSWSFDAYVPSTLPSTTALTLPQFYTNGSLNPVQGVVNFSGSGVTYGAGGVINIAAGSPSIANLTILGNNSGATAAASALSASAVATLLGSYFDAAGAASTALSTARSSPLSQFASTTSAQLASTISDETGSGPAVFANGSAINPTSIGATTPGSAAHTTVSASTSVTSPLINNVTTISSSGAILATEAKSSAGTPTRIEIYPNSTAKPDEGNASVAGTVAWAAAQLTSGGEIFVHAGTYTVATTITISTAGTRLECANPLATTFTAAASFNSDMFHVGFAGAQRQGMVVKNCGFTGNNGSNTSGQLMEVRDTTNGIISDNYFQFSVTSGLTISATVSGIVQNQVRGNFFRECVKQCYIVTNANGGDPTDSVFDDNTVGGSVIGDGTSPWVTVTSVGNMQFTNNHISGPGHTNGANFTSGSEFNVIFSHNIIETINQHGLVISGEFFTIDSNTFYNIGETTSNTYANVYLQGSSNNTIVGNTFSGSSLSKYGVYSDQGTVYNNITGNVFSNFLTDAIAFTNGFAGANTIGPNTYNGNAANIAQASTHYGPTTVPLSNPAALSTVPGQINTSGISLTQLATGPTPTITTAGTSGSSTWTYVVVPKDINGQASAAGAGGSTTTGNATLTTGNYNVIAWTDIAGAYSYDVYRTAHGTTPSTTGLIGNVLSTATRSGNGSFFLNDTALAGNGATAPTTNSTGSISGLGPRLSPAFTSIGTTFTVSGCGTATSLVGGATAGKFVGASATCTPVITTGLTAPNGLSCWMNDETTSTAAFRQTGYTTTTATFTAGGTVGSTDTIVFGCMQF